MGEKGGERREREVGVTLVTVTTTEDAVTGGNL